MLFHHYFQLLPGDTEDEIILKYSTIVAVNPLAQMIFAPIFGYLHNKIGVVRPLGISAAVIFIIGNLLYSTLSLIPSENGRYALLLLSRFLTGASAGRFEIISLCKFINRYLNIIQPLTFTFHLFRQYCMLPSVYCRIHIFE